MKQASSIWQWVGVKKYKYSPLRLCIFLIL